MNSLCVLQAGTSKFNFPLVHAELLQPRMACTYAR
jgi:hypothetical protein